MYSQYEALDKIRRRRDIIELEEDFLRQYCGESVYEYTHNTEPVLVTFDHFTEAVSFGLIEDAPYLQCWFHILSRRNQEIPWVHGDFFEIGYMRKYGLREVPPNEWPIYIGGIVSTWFEAMIAAGKYVPKPEVVRC